METLKGKTILIGREGVNSRLMITVVDGKTRKSTYVGQPGVVPNSVSRCNPAQNIAHCSITIDSNGKLTINHLKTQNVTYVNGTAVARKAVTASDRVELGKNKFQINIAEIINIAERIITAATGRQQQPQNQRPQQQQPQPAYSISHLEKVWNDYQKGLKEIREKAKRVALMRSIPIVFTMSSTALTFFARNMNWSDSVSNILGFLSVIGLIVAVYGIYKFAKFDGGDAQKEQLTNEFMKDYICPHCHHFLGNKNILIVKQDKGCPFCRCKWKD